MTKKKKKLGILGLRKINKEVERASASLNEARPCNW